MDKIGETAVDSCHGAPPSVFVTQSDGNLTATSMFPPVRLDYWCAMFKRRYFWHAR